MRSHPVPASLGTPGLAERQALDDLGFIRATLERAGRYSALSGAGIALMGVTALAASLLAAAQPTPDRWLMVWLAEAALGGGIGMASAAMRARLDGVPFLGGAGRRFLLSLLPCFLAAAVLTAAVWRFEALGLLPGLWLMLYGAAMLSAASHTIALVPRTGVAFMVTGAISLALPAVWADAMMAAGFGGLHLIFGAMLFRAGAR